MRRTLAAFTLIELLIVVAIIAILAAIAVPNFLEAQVRAKASRAKSDLRTMITALESYAVDSNKYPVPRYIDQDRSDASHRSCAQFMPGGIHEGCATAGSFATGSTVAGLTSPIAYMTSVLKDPFVQGYYDNLHSDLGYQNFDLWCEPGPGIPLAVGEAQTPTGAGNVNHFVTTTAADLLNKYGSYIVRSLGPDKLYNAATSPYDPTNGSVSDGDIYRTMKRDKNNRSTGGE